MRFLVAECFFILFKDSMMKEYGFIIYLFSVSFPQKVICISCDPAFHCEIEAICSFI